MQQLTSLDEFVRLLEDWHDDRALYVRWSRHLEADLACEVSRDDLTGLDLPGLSANGLAVEPWWGKRPTRAWLARKLYDYRHLPRRRGAGTRPWVLAGREAARGPDNEPLITDCEAVAEISQDVIDEASDLVADQPGAWAPLNRTETSDA